MLCKLILVTQLKEGDADGKNNAGSGIRTLDLLTQIFWLQLVPIGVFFRPENEDLETRPDYDLIYDFYFSGNLFQVEQFNAEKN